MAKRFPFYRQLDGMDCGPASLQMVAAYYGRNYTLQNLRESCYIDREGVSLRGIVEGAERIGLRSLPVQVPFRADSPGSPSLLAAPLPCICHWQQNHFVVLYKLNEKFAWVADPAIGKVKLTVDEFLRGWRQNHSSGIALLLETTPAFFEAEGEAGNKTGVAYLLNYLRPFRRLIWQLALAVLLGGGFQLIFPFLTRAVVDIGIENRDLNFIRIVIAGYLMLFLGQVTVNFIQSWILLHIGARVNINLIADFLVKLMRLPISFFDTKLTGDLLQRIGDHKRIEAFLTASTLNAVFSGFQFLVVGVVLWIFNSGIFLVFLGASVLYLGWVLYFMRSRAALDHRRFKELSENQSALIELIQGMTEIKLQRSEMKRRSQWMHIQARLFRVNVQALALSQKQDIGAAVISQLKDIIILLIAANAVIIGEMTLGTMLAIQFIAGQLNGPLLQFVAFVRAFQDARISLERLGEIHEKEDERRDEHQLGILPAKGGFSIRQLSFRYNPLANFALQGIDLEIPEGKVTAIVGASGSGKTTLLKLLLGFYQPTEGQVRVGGLQLSNIDPDLWRQQCGAVMQDGFIFSDTIANNIAESDDRVNKARLLKAVQAAHIQAFIESLPLNYNTRIGARGNGLSQGQRQRLLIARAVYKDPPYLFFDEATNALDAENERVILENLDRFFAGRTVVVVAHRLSTVKNADQIIVLENGQLVEKGTHPQLVEQKGAYFRLVKNQLELGE